MQHQRPSRAQNKQIKLVLVFLKKENTGRGNISQANTPNRLNAVLLGSETRQERPLSPSTQHGTWGAGGGVGWGGVLLASAISKEENRHLVWKQKSKAVFILRLQYHLHS